MEKNYSYVSPDLDWVKVDSSMCCADPSKGGKDQETGPGGDGEDWD